MYLQFGYKISSNRLAISSKRLPLFQDQTIGNFSPPSVQAIATFRQAISSHRSTQAIATLFKAIALVSWPTSPSDCLAYPSDCLLCAVTKRLLLLGKRLLAGKDKFSSFHRVLTSVLSLSYKYETHEFFSLFY